MHDKEKQKIVRALRLRGGADGFTEEEVLAVQREIMYRRQRPTLAHEKNSPGIMSFRGTAQQNQNIRVDAPSLRERENSQDRPDKQRNKGVIRKKDHKRDKSGDKNEKNLAEA